MYKCKRCKNYLNDVKGTYLIATKHNILYEDEFSVIYDLCKNCRDKLMGIIKDFIINSK